MKAISKYDYTKKVVHLWKPYIGESWECKCNGEDLHKSNLKEVQSESEGTPCVKCFPVSEPLKHIQGSSADVNGSRCQSE